MFKCVCVWVHTYIFVCVYMFRYVKSEYPLRMNTIDISEDDLLMNLLISDY